MMYQTQPAQKPLRGEITVASDKSISHRSLIFSSLAQGESTVSNLLCGEDVKCTLSILKELGVPVSVSVKNLTPNDVVQIQGVGLSGFKAPTQVLYCGNSGTTMRLMLGLLAPQPFRSELTGDESLNKRPMDRVIKPLQDMGFEFSIEDRQGQRVIVVNPEGKTFERSSAYEYKSPVASAQVKTCLLLAGLVGGFEVSVVEPALSRNHTELMLKSQGALLSSKDLKVTLQPTKSLKPLQMQVPADISSAAFFIVAALIVPGSKLTLLNVNLNPTRTGILDVLKTMQARIQIINTKVVSGEEVADLVVEKSDLKGTDVKGNVIPRLIDEIPILSLAGACSDGKFVVQDAKELRVKETDRIAAVCQEFGKWGVDVQDFEDGFELFGLGQDFGQKKASSPACSYGDHRMAMTAAIAGLRMQEPLEIDDVSCVQTSFPSFFKLYEGLR